MSEELEKKKLFKKGLRYYKLKNFYDAHEAWEDLWSDYYLEDRKFVQGLIQLSVSFVHLERSNLKGANSLLNKCKSKFKLYSGINRGIDVNLLLEEIENVEKDYQKIENSLDFNWDLVPKLD